MHVMPLNDAPRYQRGGATSYLLASSRTCGASQVTITVVDVDSGGRQAILSHVTDQSHVIIEGNGTVTVGDETRDVAAEEVSTSPAESLMAWRTPATRLCAASAQRHRASMTSPCNRPGPLSPVMRTAVMVHPDVDHEPAPPGP